MDSLTAILGSTLIATLGLLGWVVKRQFEDNTKRTDKIEQLAERSIKAIENNNVLTKEQTNVVKELADLIHKNK